MRFPLCNFTSRVLNPSAQTFAETFQLPYVKDVRVIGVFDGDNISDAYKQNSYLSQVFLSRFSKSLLTVHGRNLTMPRAIGKFLKGFFRNFDHWLCSNYIRGSASISFVLKIDNFAYVVNLGDSKTFVFRDRTLVYETQNHDHANKYEKDRMRKTDGIEINGVLNDPYLKKFHRTTRALGNCDTKHNAKSEYFDNWTGAIIAKPEIGVVWLAPNSEYSFISATDELFFKGEERKRALIMDIKQMPIPKPLRTCTELFNRYGDKYLHHTNGNAALTVYELMTDTYLD